MHSLLLYLLSLPFLIPFSPALSSVSPFPDPILSGFIFSVSLSWSHSLWLYLLRLPLLIPFSLALFSPSPSMIPFSPDSSSPFPHPFPFLSRQSAPVLLRDNRLSLVPRGTENKSTKFVKHIILTPYACIPQIVVIHLNFLIFLNIWFLSND